MAKSDIPLESRILSGNTILLALDLLLIPTSLIRFADRWCEVNRSRTTPEDRMQLYMGLTVMELTRMYFYISPAMDALERLYQ